MADQERTFFKVDNLEIRDDTKKSSNNIGTLCGYAALFNSYSERFYGDVYEQIVPGAFTDCLNSSDCRALFNHDPNLVLGREQAKTLRLREDSHGLYMEVDLPDTIYANDLQKLVKRGDISQQSFGFTIESDKWEKDEQNKRTVRSIEKIKRLYDVSPVTYPAYPETDVLARMHEAYEKRNKKSQINKSAIIRFLETKYKYHHARGLFK